MPEAAAGDRLRWVLWQVRRNWRRAGPLGTAAVLLLCTLAVYAAWQANRPDPFTPSGGATVRVGVRDGDSIPGYVLASRAELDGLAAGGDGIYALVSLTGYLSPDALAPLLGPTRSLLAFARVPDLGEQTELVRLPAMRVPSDVVTAMDEVALRKEGEATGPSRLAGLAAAEASRFRAHCACVFALVVRGTGGALRRLARRPEVRVIDPAPEVSDLRSAVFVAPLPEQVDRVHPPP